MPAIDPSDVKARVIAIRGPVLDVAVSGPLPPINHALVVGNPARQKGWVCECTGDLQELACTTCGLRYRSGDTGLVRCGGP